MYTDNISNNDKTMMDGFCLVESVTTKPIKNPRQLLTSMALDFPTNAVTAILGPSGSGKTTVLSVITDNIQSNVTCRAQVHLPGVSAMVPQDDRLHGFYTVQTYLEHYARLAGLYAASAKDTAQEAASIKDAVQERIERLIQQLGLVDQTDTIVGDLFLKGLSGGQKRRLSIALEALSQPTNFFLDEPTSGLDAESALQVMEFLKDYARGAAGRRVILTIHQPSSFIWQTIDHVILLSKGQLMYNGGRVQCEDFFAAQGYPTLPGWNPADHYVTAVNDEFRNHAMSVAEWATKFKEWKSSESTNDDDDAVNGSTAAPASSKHNSNHIHRLQERSKSILEAASKAEINTNRSRSGLQTVMELTRRYFLNLALNPGILGTRIAMYIMLALMVGALFWNLGERNDFEVCLYKTIDSNVNESRVSRLYTSNHRFYVSCPAVDSIACRNCLLLCRLFHFYERRRLALYRHGARHCRQGSQQQVLPSHRVPNFPRHLQHSRCCAIGLFGVAPHYYNAQTQRPSLVFPQYVLGSSRRRGIGAARFPRGSAFHHWYGLARGNVWLFYALSRIHARAFGIPKLAAMGL
jgi:ABC-type multidrug transport system ATPase subunit